MKKKVMIKNINILLHENKNINDMFKIKFKLRKNISINELKDFFLLYPDLEDIFIKKRNLIFKFNLIKEKSFENNVESAISILKENENIKLSYSLKELSEEKTFKESLNNLNKIDLEEDNIIKEISIILNITYKESLLLSDIVSEFLNKEDIIISDSLINSFFYILKIRLNQTFEKEIIISLLEFLKKNLIIK
jgi:hypothetical protein